ncbi:unnamed protein product [Sphagnum tenellum]
MHGYRVFLQISFEVVAVFAKHHQEDTGIPNHFALPGVHGHDSNKRHRICNGTLALGCGYSGGLYSSCSHGRHGRRQGYCTVPFEQNSAKLSKCVINSYGMALPSAIIAVQVVTITPFRPDDQALWYAWAPRLVPLTEDCSSRYMDVVAMKDRICDGIVSLGHTYCEVLQLAALQAAAAMTDKGEDKDMAQQKRWRAVRCAWILGLPPIFDDNRSCTELPRIFDFKMMKGTSGMVGAVSGVQPNRKLEETRMQSEKILDMYELHEAIAMPRYIWPRI